MEHFSEYLKFYDGARIEDRLFFANMTFNGIFYLDLKELSVHFVQRFPGEALNAMALSMVTMVDNNNIYFFPHNSNSILRYNIKTQIEEAIKMPDFDGEKFEMTGAVSWNNKIYMFPILLKRGIYVLDTQRQELIKDKKLSELFADTDFRCVNVFSVNDKHVLLSLDGSNQLIEIDLDTKEIVSLETLPADIQIYTVCYDGAHYWILQKQSSDIYEWDREHGILQRYVNENLTKKGRDHISFPLYSNLVFLEKEILVLNCLAEHVLRINKEKKVIEDPIDFPKGFRLVNRRFEGWPICDQYTIFENKVLLHPNGGNMLLIYDPGSKTMCGKEMTISGEETPYLCEVIKENWSEKKLNVELDNLRSLSAFIYAVSQGWETMSSCHADNIGKVIYQCVEEEKA